MGVWRAQPSPRLKVFRAGVRVFISHHRNKKVKRRARTGLGMHGKAKSFLDGQGMNQGKPKSGTLACASGFGGEKRFEDSIQNFGWNSRPRVSHRYLHVTCRHA